MKKISDILREARVEKKLSIEEVSSSTKIKEEFLRAIEAGQYQRLPSESYAMGFVKNYAKFLGIPLVSAIPLFRREYSAKHALHIVPEFRKTQHKFNNRIFSARNIFILAGVLIIGIYIFFQYSSLVFPPGLTIISPKNNTIPAGNIVNITGKTDAYNTVSINGEDVYVDLQGIFKKSIYLFAGNNKIKIVAKNRFGKTTEKDINVDIK